MQARSQRVDSAKLRGKTQEPNSRHFCLQLVTLPTGSTSTTVTHGAWTAGAGLEYGITDHLSARVEYLYLDTGNIMTGVIGPPATTITSQLKDNLVRAALNYRFPVGW
jgi:opacity protein-like surface antigen